MTNFSRVGVSVLFVLAMAASAQPAAAHCDTLNGPVVAAARIALAQGSVTPALKWVKETDEGELREAFQQALTVRRLSAEARELADRYFFETLVRLHRQGEGEPYSGLKPAAAVDPGIAEADTALETGSADEVVARATAEIAAGIRARFAAARALRAHADESVLAGRDYVAAYVAFIHFVERLHLDVTAAGHDRVD